jgi:hypothetical protein
MKFGRLRAASLTIGRGRSRLVVRCANLLDLLILRRDCRALAAAVAVVPAAAASADDASGVASSRMSYSRFLEYLDMGRVKKVSVLVVCV